MKRPSFLPPAHVDETDLGACVRIAAHAYAVSDTSRTLSGLPGHEAKATSAIAEGLRRFTRGESAAVKHAAAARMADIYYVSACGKVKFSAAAPLAAQWAREHVAAGGRVIL